MKFEIIRQDITPFGGDESEISENFVLRGIDRMETKSLHFTRAELESLYFAQGKILGKILSTNHRWPEGGAS
jgi:hypothetical protein